MISQRIIIISMMVVLLVALQVNAYHQTYFRNEMPVQDEVEQIDTQQNVQQRPQYRQKNRQQDEPQYRQKIRQQYFHQPSYNWYPKFHNVRKHNTNTDYRGGYGTGQQDY